MISHNFDVIVFGRPAGLWKTGLVSLLAISIVLPLSAREKDAVQYGMGLIVNVPFPESEVSQVVQDVVQNGIIRGTKEYNKDEYVAGATAETTARVFPAWTEGGTVFYKVRLHALDPRNFKDSGDVGTLAVRYVLQPQGENNTVLHINAVFVEEFRHTVHQSNGSVEAAEYKEIHDRLDAVSSMKASAAEAERERQQVLAEKPGAPASAVQTSTTDQDREAAVRPKPTPAVPQTLEEHVKDLRSQVERLVKSPGAALKSAPFHSASTLQSLAPGTEVLMLISTPYWFGVETHEGQHGWILRSDLEQLP